ADFGICDRLLGNRIVAIERVTEAQFVRQSGIEGMDVLKTEQAIVECLAGSKSRNVWPCATKAGQHQELRCIGEEGFYCQRITAGEPKVSIRVELVFLEVGGRRSREKPICPRCRNHELAIWKLRVEQRQRSSIYCGNPKCFLQ